MLKKYWHRVVYRSEGRQVPFLIYPFLLMTFVPGFAYTFFGDTTTVSVSTLYQLTAVTLGAAGLSLWGVAAMSAAVLAVANIILRKKWAGRTAPLLGFMVWLYAIIIYLSHGFVYQILSYAVPQISFWIWHYVRVEGYWRNFESGEESIE